MERNELSFFCIYFFFPWCQSLYYVSLFFHVSLFLICVLFVFFLRRSCFVHLKRWCKDWHNGLRLYQIIGEKLKALCRIDMNVLKPLIYFLIPAYHSIYNLFIPLKIQYRNQFSGLDPRKIMYMSPLMCLEVYQF